MQKGFVPILIILLVAAAAALGGYLIYQKQSKSTPSLQPTTQPSPSPTDETANWKTYRDERLMFRYPEDWTIDPVQVFGSRSEIEFKYQKTSAFSLTYIANYNNGTEKPFTTLEEFTGTRRDRYSKEILLAGQKAKYIVDPGDPGHVISYEEVLFFSPDNKAIVSLHYEQSYYDVPKANKILDQILSTFKFISQTDTTDWKTYTNASYTFQYPSSWGVTEGFAKTADHSENTVQILNKSGSVQINISPEQQIYGFSGGVDSKHFLTVNINGQNYQVKENIVSNRTVFVDFQIGTSKYHILFGTGYPAGEEILASISDYNLMKETILKILSTFKFNNQIDTANWQTYNDHTFGYSFKYPLDFKTLPGLGDHVFYSMDAQFDKTTTAKTKGIEIGTAVYNFGEDTEGYIGPNTIIDASLVSKLTLPPGLIAKAYVNTEDITVTIDYKKDNKNMRIMIWCGGENGNSSSCKNVLIPLLSTFKFTQ